MKSRLYILVTGTRYATIENLPDIDRVLSAEINSRKWHSVEIVVGDADGVDALVRRWWAGMPVILQPRTGWRANWDAHGKQAGPIRNKLMVDYVAECIEKRRSDVACCLVFPASNHKSTGTNGCLKLAKEAGITTVITPIEVDPAVIRGEKERFRYV